MGPEDVKKGVDAMYDVLESQPEAGAETLATDAPGTKSPGTDAPGTEAPGTAMASTEAPSTEAPAEDLRDEEIRRLREELARKEVKKSAEPPPTKAPSTYAPISEEDFLGDSDLDELTRDPKLFNQLLNKIYKKAREDARSEINRGDELVIKSMPDIVKTNIALVAKLKEINEQFYNENKDLKPFKRVVGAVFEELIADNPDKSYEQLLPNVAKEARNRLELHIKATNSNNREVPPTEKVRGGKRQQSKPNTNSLVDEISKMDEVLGL